MEGIVVVLLHKLCNILYILAKLIYIGVYVVEDYIDWLSNEIGFMMIKTNEVNCMIYRYSTINQLALIKNSIAAKFIHSNKSLPVRPQAAR